MKWVYLPYVNHSSTVQSASKVLTFGVDRGQNKLLLVDYKCKTSLMLVKKLLSILNVLYLHFKTFSCHSQHLFLYFILQFYERWSDCSIGSMIKSSLKCIWICSRHKKQTTFSGQTFIGRLRVKMLSLIWIYTACWRISAYTYKICSRWLFQILRSQIMLIFHVKQKIHLKCPALFHLQ